MFLKSIEIQGFKSFAHKTVLNFNEGMTAIVGPNGSGKSNIADAVRWVLGEQKVKQLRGSSMQDVIFAGTELRKPLGFAYVSMLFDNSDRKLALDYAEVSVSRRLYRSGESEYMINGQTVRLKDVQELFFDTGIGKEGYSIIGQGQIEAIVSGRPEDRRGLFDEACGIVKFKKRKQAAEKKLEEETVNLNRISDIKNELERRIGPLEKQSQNAREYLRLRDILKVYELTIFVQETEELLRELEENRSNREIVEDSIRRAREEGEKLKALNLELSEEIRKTEEAINQGREDKQKGELLITNLESQISVAETEIGAENANIRLFEENLEKLSAEKKKMEGTVRSYLQTIRRFKSDAALLSDQSGTFSETEELRKIGLLSEELSACEESLKEMFPGADCPEETETAAEINTESSTDEAEEDAFEFEEPEWLRSIKNKRDDLSEVNEKAEGINEWIRKAEYGQKKREEKLKTASAVYNEKKGQRDVLQSRLETLKNIAERYEGYGAAVQAVMQLRTRYPGILGVVADLIHTEFRYETAIETALGNRIQNVVTDKEQTAKELIGYLKKFRMGRVTFLPLDAVKAKPAEECGDAVKEQGCLGLASELVEYDSVYEELVSSLLGNRLVFDTVENALACARKYGHRLHIVTLEGEYLSPGGSISGGAFKSASNLMGRSRELEDLEKKIRLAEAEIREIKEDISDAEEAIAQGGKELEGFREQLKEVNEEKNRLSFGLVSDLKLKLSNLAQSAHFIIENVQRIRGESQKNLEEETEQRDKIGSAKRSISEKQERILARKEDIVHVQQGIASSLENARKAQEKKEALAGDQSGYFEQKDRINEETLALEKDLLRLENSREKLNSRLDAETAHIWNEYGLTLTEAKKFSDDKLGTLTVMKQKVSELGGAIKALGMINIPAIEEYREVSERYELLKEQYRDICTAREQVTEIINDLDTGMKEQFNEQFANIRTEFQKVFRELFGGGQADLELYYDEESGDKRDELNAGISIIAQPPGKKLQNMLQLSGGEKAFTAIALLFAIQNLKPSPFCLLDEIEAALDDSNVFRFAGYIRRICDRSQFILITHRRGTMEAADRLYGITMQEKGVTSLVSVDLVEDAVK